MWADRGSQNRSERAATLRRAAPRPCANPLCRPSYAVPPSGCGPTLTPSKPRVASASNGVPRRLQRPRTHRRSMCHVRSHPLCAHGSDLARMAGRSGRALWLGAGKPGCPSMRRHERQPANTCGGPICGWPGCALGGSCVTSVKCGCHAPEDPKISNLWQIRVAAPHATHADGIHAARLSAAPRHYTDPHQCGAQQGELGAHAHHLRWARIRADGRLSTQPERASDKRLQQATNAV